ncbi:MAG: DUF86 domain-containing protein [Methanocalculus sp.]|uniref:HepT-like ribonuclease domain-containing protein n=1 Tax=Methanocalculus sp. TaxID=2004547 RepID=UPI0027292228|nr:HepT-like ribonuclease domain-containing protein [Methanocalculus sp.]MDO9539745.1 DUF86 domain-containing protein [Methanocalculus sp.]
MSSGSMGGLKSRKEIVSILKDLKSEMGSLFGVTQLGLFTPPIPGETGVCAIVAFSGDRDILDMASLSRFIEGKVGQRLRIISLMGLRDELKPCILQAEEVTQDDLLIFQREIICSISDIERFCRGMRYEEFIDDEKTCQAVLSLIISIGLFSRCLSDGHMQKYPAVPWHALTALPDMISPCYGTDLRLIWNLVERRLPSIRRSLEALAGMKSTEAQQKRRFF